MPKKLEEFLKGLGISDLCEVWDYLDGNPEAVPAMIQVLAEEAKRLGLEV